MINYTDINLQILDKWYSAAMNNDEDKDKAFVYDGLLYRGEIFYEDNIWKRKSAKESELWSNSFPRILLITKDYNDQDDHPAGDIIELRQETLRQNQSGKDIVRTSRLQFHTNMMYHVFGLGHFKDGHCPAWENLTPDESRRYYESCPLVRINVKKQAGGGYVSDSTMREYINKYDTFLNQQISLFDADIIICYGRVIFDYVIQNFFPDIEKHIEDPWVYFSTEKQKVIINSYHPSVRRITISDKHFYTYPMIEFEQMMHEHPEFAAKYLNCRR